MDNLEHQDYQTPTILQTKVFWIVWSIIATLTLGGIIYWNFANLPPHGVKVITDRVK